MIQNFFKIAGRNLWKNKTSTLVNLLSLAIGMTCCMLILIYVADEISYNKFNTNFPGIYGVNWTVDVNNQVTESATTPIPLGPVIKTDIPQIAYAGRLYQRSGEMQLRTSDSIRDRSKRFQEQHVFFADGDLFHIFSIIFKEGDLNTALATPNSVVITDEMAKKYFGAEDPIGKTFFYDNKELLQVTGIVQKMPANSDLQFDFLVSFETLFSVESKPIADFLSADWTINSAYTYVLLKPGESSSHVANALNQLLKKYGDSRSQLVTISLQPLSRIHLYASGVNGNPSSTSILFICIFTAIAFLILLIANVNFINLATARSITRSREVGMRKVLGAGKHQLVIQFLSEAVLLSLIAFLGACFFNYFGLPVLNQLTGKNYSWHDWLNVSSIITFAVLFFITGIVAGLYPAFFITRFSPSLTIKGKSGEASGRNAMRKILMVTQFSISIVLMVGAIIIYQQLQLMRNKPLGFQKDQIISIPIFGSNASTIEFNVDGPMRKRMNAFCDELLQSSRIKAVTASSAMPGQGFVLGLVIPQGFSEKDNFFVPWVSVDYNFISTLDIPILAGRNFSKSTGTDHLNAFILNESAVRSFGWKSPEDALGKNIIRGDEQNGKKGQVIGVVKDFNFNTLDQPLQPLIMDVSAVRFTTFAVSVQPDHLPETIQYIKQKWDAAFPERIFEYSFLDDDIAALYNSQANLGKIIGYFAVIGILLCCFGLFSLASFLSIQRTKEIGIRKVLGASIPNILFLLSKDFLILILIASLISVPVAWYASNSWLQSYAYRISIHWWIFPAATFLAASVAMVTISLQVLKAAVANPIKSLRTE